MRKIIFLTVALLAVGLAGHARAQDACPLSGDPSQGWNVVYWDGFNKAWGSAGTYSCSDCAGSVAAWNSWYGWQAGCSSYADEQNGKGWYCVADTGFWAGTIEPNSSSYRAAFLLNDFISPAYWPPSTGYCISSSGAWLDDSP